MRLVAWGIAGTIAMLAVFITACEATSNTPLPATVVGTLPATIDVGPITFVGRIQLKQTTDIDADQLDKITTALKPYGTPRPVWADAAKTTLDVTLRRARFEFAGSFIQEHLDLGASGAVPWRLTSVRYRANFIARRTTFRLRGSATPGTEVALDAGEGFVQVPLTESGDYELQIPFSPRRRVAFLRLTAGGTVRYGQIEWGQKAVKPLTAEQYLKARQETILAPSADLPDGELDPDADPDADAVPMPQTRPVNPASARSPSPLMALESLGIRAMGMSAQLPDPIGELPPKTLSQPIAIDVHLVLEGLGEDDPLIEALHDHLLPYGLQRERFDPETELWWLICKVLDLEDIKRIHRTLETYAKDHDLPLVPLSRYLTVTMEWMRLAGELTTTLRGRVMAGSTLELLDSAGNLRPVAVDTQGRYVIEVDSTASSVFGVCKHGARQWFMRVDLLSGISTPITAEEFEAARKRK